MARIQVLRSVLLAAGVLAMSACATQPEVSLLEKKFQREANNYQQFQHEGQTVYCQRAGTKSMPMHCVSESQLRLQVENMQRSRNLVQRGGPPYVATVPGGSGT